MKFQAVLFDLDGTLLDTLEDLMEAVNKGLDSLGFPAHGPTEFKYFVGEGREEMARKSLPEKHQDADTVARLVDFINVYYLQHWADHTRPYPGVPEMLDGLTARGVRMAVLSNKPDDFTKLAVSGLLAGWNFDLVVGALPGVPKKPDPEPAIRVAETMKIIPSRFLYLGDSGIDMQTAVRAGMFPVGALWGFRPLEELKACGASILIKEPVQVLNYLEK